MTFTLPKISVGRPLLAKDIPMFPLYLDAPTGPSSAYILAAEAKKMGALSVEAAKEEGSFLVGNNGDRPVLLLWREPLKQVRLGTSLLVAPKAVVTIPAWLVLPYHPLGREGSYRKHAVGAVVVDQVFLLNLFDQQSTCRRVWRRLLHTPHRWPEPKICHSIGDVRSLWDEACEANWEPMDTVGAGQAWRASGEELRGWALTLGDALVHLQVAAPCWAKKRKKEKSKGLGRIPKRPRKGQADERQLWLPFTDE